MKRRLYWVVLLILALCMGGCQKKNQIHFMEENQSEIPAEQDGDEEMPQEGGYQTSDGEIHNNIWDCLDQAKQSEDKIVWIIPTPISGAWYEADRLVKFNEKLKKEKGLELELCYLQENDGQYGEQLQEILKKGYGDLCFSGSFFQTDAYFQDQKALVESGLLHDLGDLSGSEEERVIRDAFDEKEWKGVNGEDGTFFLPTQDFFPHRTYVAFSKKYIPQKKAEQFDGKLDSLMEYVDDMQEDELGRNTLIWNMSYYDTLYTLGIYQLGGLWYNHETGEAEPAFSSEKWYSVFKMLHDCRERDIMFRPIQWDATSTPQAYQKIRENKFAVAVFINDSLLEYVRDTSTVFELPYYFAEANTGHTAIVEQSEKKQKVYSLLSGVLGDPAYANLLILGEKGKDYYVKSGYAYTMDGEPAGAVVCRSAFSVNDLVYNASGNMFGKDVQKEKKAYFSSKKCRTSALNGFCPDFGEISSYPDEKYMKIWKQDDFESQYKKVQEMFAKKQKKDVETVNRQIQEWRKTK